MPELCRFDGIIIRMYSEPDSPHKLPHLHAYYQDKEAIVSLDGILLEGDLPSKKLRHLLVWMDYRKDDLSENWRLLMDGQKFYKIQPLR